MRDSERFSPVRETKARVPPFTRGGVQRGALMREQMPESATQRECRKVVVRWLRNASAAARAASVRCRQTPDNWEVRMHEVVMFGMYITVERIRHSASQQEERVVEGC